MRGTLIDDLAAFLGQVDSTREPVEVTRTGVATFGWLVGVLLIVVGFAMIYVAKRTAAGSMGRNRYAGIRTKVTMASDEAWHAAHIAGEADMAKAGRVGQLTGATAIVLGTAGWFEAAAPAQLQVAIALVILTGSAALVVLVLRAGRKGTAAARDR